MISESMSSHAAIQRLRLILPMLGSHEPRLSTDLNGPDASELHHIRMRHLAEVGEMLNQHSRPELRVDTLLGCHRVVLMWLADLAGRPLEPTELHDPFDRAVLDTVTALLLWHVAKDFYQTQRLVQFCHLRLERSS